MIQPERKTVTISDGPVSVLCWPGDARKPALHFAHANGFNAGTYRILLSPLAGRFRIFASDLRGHGLTDLPADPASHSSWATYGSDVAELLDQLDAGPYVLAGHSMGAVASALAAAANPSRISGLLMIEPVTFPLVWRAWRRLHHLMRGRMPDPPFVVKTMRRRAVFPDRDMAFRAYKGRGAFRTWPDDVLRDFVEHGLVPHDGDTMRLACPPEWEAANYRVGPPRLAAALKRLTCPVTILYGTRQSTVRPGELRVMRRAAPHARVLRVEGATHFLPKEHPDLVRAELVRLLEQDKPHR